MVDIDLMIEYQQLFEDVPPMLWTRAHINVSEKIDLPNRGAKGDPINDFRVHMFLQEVVKEIHRLRDERGG